MIILAERAKTKAKKKNLNKMINNKKLKCLNLRILRIHNPNQKKNMKNKRKKTIVIRKKMMKINLIKMTTKKKRKMIVILMNLRNKEDKGRGKE